MTTMLLLTSCFDRFFYDSPGHVYVHKNAFTEHGFPADIEGSWQFPGFTLVIERAQGDPYAAPTRVRVQVDGRQASSDECEHDICWPRCVAMAEEGL